MKIRDLRLTAPAGAAWLGSGLGLQASPLQSLAAAALASAAALACLRHLRRPPRARHVAPGPRLAALALLTCLAAALACASAARATQARTSHPLTQAAARGQTVGLVGRICSHPTALPTRFATERWQVRLCVDQLNQRPATGLVRVVGPAAWRASQRGQQVRVVGKLRPTANQSRYEAELSTRSGPQLLTPATGPAAWRARVTAQVRQRATTNPDTLIAAMGWGQRTDVPAELTAALRATSLTHLSAVSGTHLAIVVGAVLAVGNFLPRGARLTLTVAAILAFTWFVGPSASILRAATMTLLAVAALAAARSATASASLAATALAMLIADPRNALDYSFALSVLATGGIVLLSPPLTRGPARWLPRPLAQALAVPVAAQLATLPVAVLLQPALPTWAVPANLLAAPAVPGVSIGALLACVGGPVGQVGWWISRQCARWVAWQATWWGSLPGAAVPWPSGRAGVAAAVGLLLLLVCLGGGRRLRQGRASRAARASRAVPLTIRQQRRVAARVGLPWRRGPADTCAVRKLRRLGARLLMLLLVVALGLVGLWWLALPPLTVASDWEVVQCDVGQGSALAVRSGPSSAVLVDTGPAGADVVGCLRSAGITHLHLLVISHVHADHIGELASVLAAFPVEQALVGPSREPQKTVSRVESQLRAATGQVLLAQSGQTGQAGEVSWRVLGPAAATTAQLANDPDSLNDLSAVVHLERAGLDVLVPGDVEYVGQLDLLNALWAGPGPADGHWDVAVVPHHGSPRQDDRLPAELAATTCLISVGKHNDYGHPARRTLRMYQKACPVLRTDECGQISLAGQRDAAGLVAGVRADSRCGAQP
ncbi:ComEC/Rec2 family competence protein [Buchananella hordeovulneris]|uniref:Metallo-beta-lactamase domain-containing protein n=1 Tax=Buchananella hordeovulneris TaxID=52770 RepID=A0A1Q5PWX7_9ACTO|nr:ComEC/Rec2 family competence protein [Buchananella hordeovulneris]OKL52006.1 hypothetical protein BSZ40_03500 [Buchananella hordeovulneris]